MRHPKEILQRSSKKLCLEAVQQATDSDEFLTELLNLSLSKEEPYNKRASWSVLYLGERHPKRIMPHLRRIADQLNTLENHTQIASFLRLFDVLLFNMDEFGHLFDFCIHTIRMPQEREYVRVIALNILLKFGKTYAALIPEILDNIELAQDTYTMRHCKAKAISVLKELKTKK
jgi:hypothetical protein